MKDSGGIQPFWPGLYALGGFWCPATGGRSDPDIYKWAVPLLERAVYKSSRVESKSSQVVFQRCARLVRFGHHRVPELGTTSTRAAHTRTHPKKKIKLKTEAHKR